MLQYILKITLLLIFLSKGIISFSQTFHPDYVDSFLYLKTYDTSAIQLNPYDSSRVALNSLIDKYDIRNFEQPFQGQNTTLDHTYKVKFRYIEKTDSLMMALRGLGYVEYVEQVPLYRTQFTPNDYDNAVQWSLEQIDAAGAWDETLGDSTIVIAIVDNAVLLEHEDLKATIWDNPGETGSTSINNVDDDLNGYVDDKHGYDVADDDSNPNPPPNTTDTSAFVHGTAVAGIAAATTNNNKGIASLGYKVEIMAVKGSRNSSDGSSLSDAYEGVDYARKAGADVINMSWGNHQFTITGQNIINTAHQEGIVLIGAAGNGNTSESFYPAAYDNVIAVGATDKEDKKTFFSNYGTYVDVMAPGINIYTLSAGTDSSYSNKSGTSMSAPLTSGLAGLVLSKYSNLSPRQVRDSLRAGCVDIDSKNPEYADSLGAGRINAHMTLDPAETPTNIVQNTSTGHNNLIYPNPVENQLIIEWDSYGKGKVRIYDLIGQRMSSKSVKDVNQRRMTLSVGHLPAGIYLVELSTKQGKSIHKIAVK